MKNSSVLLLNGSPKKQRGTSNMLLDFLADRLMERGLEVRQKRISSCLESDDDINDLIEDIESSYLIFMVFPLYVDSLPYNVIEALEVLRKRLPDKEKNRLKNFMVLCQSGMEVHKNRIALQICQRFAKEIEFNYRGGLALGYGGVLNGAPLDSLNRLTKRVQKALVLLADGIAGNSDLPAEIQRLLARPLLPGPMWVKLFLFNNAMKKCLEKRSFNQGIDVLHSRLKLFYS